MNKADRNYRWVTLATLLIIMLVFTFLTSRLWPEAGIGAGAPDTWTQLYIAEQLHTSHDWFNHTTDRLNAPHGSSLQPTRVYSAFLLAGAAMLQPLMPFKEALLTWGLWSNVLLALWAALALAVVVRRLGLGVKAELLAAPALFLLACNLQLFAPGMVTHQGLLLAVFLSWLAAIIPALQGAYNRKAVTKAAALAALAVWISPSFLVVLAFFYLWMACGWVKNNAATESILCVFSSMLFIFLALALLAEVGPEAYFIVAYDRLSILYVTLFGLISGVTWALHVYLSGVSAWRTRLIAGGVTVLAIAGLMQGVYADFYMGPLHDVSGFMRQYFLNSLPAFTPVTLTSPPQILIAMILLPLVLLFGVAWGIRGGVFRPGALWILLLMFLVGFAALGLWQPYWQLYAFALLAIGVAALLEWWLGRYGMLLWAASGVIWALVAVSLSMQLPASENAENKDCEQALVSMIQNNQLGSEEPLTILVPPQWAGQLLYWTPHRAVASYDHRNEGGMRDTYTFFDALTDEMPRQTLAMRKVDRVLFCPERYTPRMSAPKTFLTDLLAGKLPAWLEVVKENPGAEAGLRYFRVK